MLVGCIKGRNLALLATKTLGSVERSTAHILAFPEGLYGFPDEKEFALIEESKDSPFLWLQSAKQAELAFVIIDPGLFCKASYFPEVAPMDLETLGAKSVAECSVYLIVTIPSEHPEEMTANMQGPVLLNLTEKSGRQVISLNDEHGVRVPILSQLEG